MPITEKHLALFRQQIELGAEAERKVLESLRGDDEPLVMEPWSLWAQKIREGVLAVWKGKHEGGESNSAVSGKDLMEQTRIGLERLRRQRPSAE